MVINGKLSLAAICRKVFDLANFDSDAWTLDGVAEEVYQVMNWETQFTERRVVSFGEEHFLFEDSDPNWARFRRAMTKILHEQDDDGHRVHLWFSDDPDSPNIWKHRDLCSMEEVDEWADKHIADCRDGITEAKWQKSYVRKKKRTKARSK
jgi:hypothetical protein